MNLHRMTLTDTRSESTFCVSVAKSAWRNFGRTTPKQPACTQSADSDNAKGSMPPVYWPHQSDKKKVQEVLDATPTSRRNARRLQSPPLPVTNNINLYGVRKGAAKSCPDKNLICGSASRLMSPLKSHPQLKIASYIRCHVGISYAAFRPWRWQHDV